MIYVEGKLRTRSWEKEGVTRYTTEVIGDNMTMLSTRRDGGDSRPATSAPSSAPQPEPKMGGDATDDLPF
jgi:single-strand DNA-binding protein